MIIDDKTMEENFTNPNPDSEEEVGWYHTQKALETAEEKIERAKEVIRYFKELHRTGCKNDTIICISHGNFLNIIHDLLTY